MKNEKLKSKYSSGFEASCICLQLTAYSLQLNSEPNVQVSDTTAVDSCAKAGEIFIDHSPLTIDHFIITLARPLNIPLILLLLLCSYFYVYYFGYNIIMDNY